MTSALLKDKSLESEAVTKLLFGSVTFDESPLMILIWILFLMVYEIDIRKCIL